MSRTRIAIGLGLINAHPILLGAGQGGRADRAPPYTSVEPLAFEDNPLEPERPTARAIGAAFDLLSRSDATGDRGGACLVLQRRRRVRRAGRGAESCGRCCRRLTDGSCSCRRPDGVGPWSLAPVRTGVRPLCRPDGRGGRDQPLHACGSG